MKKIIILIGIILAVIIVLGAVVTLVFSNTEIAYKPNTNENRVVQPVKFGHANVYFIKTKNGHILVDAGMPGDSTKLDNVFSIAGIDPQSIRLIIVTHGHLDHTGLLAYAKAATGAEVLSHESLSKKLADGEGEAAIPQNSFGHFLNFMTGLQNISGGADIEGITPDILVKDSFDLSEYGITGKVIHTPGHSLGSVSIILDNGETLVGDMIRPEGEGIIGPGMFYEDKETLINSLEKVASFESETIYLSHGDTIDNTTLNKTIAALKNE